MKKILILLLILLLVFFTYTVVVRGMQFAGFKIYSYKDIKKKN